MTQVDLDTLVTGCVGGGKDNKIGCETLADGGPDAAVHDDDRNAADVPPESFWLSKDAEYDWFDRNAFYERKDSTKGNFNSNSNSTNLNPLVNPSTNSNSQRKSKASSIIGLPKTQKNTFRDSKRRTCKATASIRLFPKRSASTGKSTVPVAEPGSPKVSCMGRVRSKRCRRRSNSLKRTEKPVEKLTTNKTGFCSKVMGMFRSKKGHQKSDRSVSRKTEDPVVEPQRRSVGVKARVPGGGEPVVAEAPGLGGMNRFASGRRSSSWTAEEFDQAVS